MSDRNLSTTARLDLEWNRLRERPALVLRAASWELTPTPPSTLDDVLVAVGWHGDRGTVADGRLRRLVEIARTDDLAARIVIERLKPGLLCAARRHRNQPDAFEDLLAAAWIAVRTYNPKRRPSNIAVSLISDADYGAYRQSGRRRGSREQPSVDIFEVMVETMPRDAAVELAELLDDAQASGMARDELDLVRRLAVNPRTEDVARDLEVSARTVRNRRDRVTRKLREIALAA